MTNSVLYNIHFFYFYYSNLQGLTIQQYKNKKIYNTSTKQSSNLEEILHFLNKVCTRRGHIKINNNNNDNNNNDNDNNIYIYIYIYINKIERGNREREKRKL